MLKRIAIGSMLVMLATGCGVSKKVVAQMEADKNAEIQQLTQERNASDNALAICRAKKSGLEARAASAREDLEKSRAEYRTCLDDYARLEEDMKRLRKRLKARIDDKTAEIEMLKDKLTVRLIDTVLFGSGEATLDKTGVEVLKEVAAVVGPSNMTVRVGGHTDDVNIGPSLREKYATNWELSLARSLAVLHYLQANGPVDGKRLVAEGYGAYHPIASNKNPEEMKYNRRVEIVLTSPNF